MTYLVGVDIGGTFTDTFLYHPPTGESFRSKTLTTPDDLSAGVMSGLRKAARQTDLDPDRVSRIVHGSTVATNAILEGKGARVGLVTTQGYEHILHLARSWTPGPLAGWIGMRKPAPLASLEDTVGIRERMSAQGDVVEKLDEQHVRDSLRELEGAGIESLTVCLLNSYANPNHELRIGEIGAEVVPELPISLSSDLLPEFREYERAMVTVMNAYIQPRVRRYLVDLQARIGETYPEARIDVLRSDGGRMSVDAAVGQPVHMILSGPAGGVSGARRVAEQVASTNFLTLDMGGTSTDVSIVVDGSPQISRETKVGFFPVSSPAINIRSVGAGGGSIAKVADYSGALRVGPESAGAEPGPACYGRGGVQPTVTDANAVLGYLPAALAGGEMSLDLDAAKAALAPLADAMGLSLHEAAGGVVDIVNENMLGALRLVSVEQGYHPADFALIAYGGAGPLHANKLGELLGSFPVVIPATPGILCALGDLASDYRSEFAQSFIRTVDATTLEEVLGRLRAVGAQARGWLAGEGIAGDVQQIQYEIDVRYHRQGLALPIPVSLAALEEAGLEGVGERFSQAHERAYGFRLGTVVEVVVLRAVAQGVTPEVETASVASGGVDPSPALTGRATIHHANRPVEAPVFDRARLREGNVVRGPAIITQMDSTTLVLAGYRGVVDAHGNILIDREE